MPVIPIIGAIGAMAMGGATAIGAVIAGTATLAETLTAVAAVGASLGAIGAVTHDKTLTTVGMVMGGIGGVGALAANAGLLGASATTESLFGSSSGAMESVTVTPQAWGADAALTDAGRSALQAAGNSADADIINRIGALDTSSIGLPSLPAVESASAAINPIGALPVNSGPAAASGTLPDGGLAATNAGITPGADNGITGMAHGVDTGLTPAGQRALQDAAASGAPSTPQTPGVVAVTAPSVGDEPGFFSNLMNNQYAQYGMIQAGGSLISGMFDPLKPAQVSALDAQSAANRAAATLAQTQQANMAQKIPVASRAGLINSKPVASPAVTGRVAA